MAWFKRKTKGIQTSTKEKKDTPEGLWHKTPTGKIIDTEELEKNFYVSPEDGFHLNILNAKSPTGTDIDQFSTTIVSHNF